MAAQYGVFCKGFNYVNFPKLVVKGIIAWDIWSLVAPPDEVTQLPNFLVTPYNLGRLMESPQKNFGEIALMIESERLLEGKSNIVGEGSIKAVKLIGGT